jgi:hypothetical protein
MKEVDFVLYQRCIGLLQTAADHYADFEYSSPQYLDYLECIATISIVKTHMERYPS